MRRQQQQVRLICVLFFLAPTISNAFTINTPLSETHASKRTTTNTASSFMRCNQPLSRMSAAEDDVAVTSINVEDEDEEPMDAATRLMKEKQKRADELRKQEVFLKQSTGIYSCNNCDWDYDETKGDSFMIGGLVQPGTKFSELPSNWRCPTCRASKDSFAEVTKEIAGFEVNQGYGFGGNSMTGDDKNLLIFGGLGLFFILFLSGYGLS